MNSIAEAREGAQRVHRESLGEMEEKRSYRRDTVVLALLELVTGAGEKSVDARSSRSDAQRGASTLFYQLQQARGTETGDRIAYWHWLTLKNPARHRNSQRRICQMPDFHKSLPTPDPCSGRDYEGPVVN
jgi:hypothetical protein